MLNAVIYLPLLTGLIVLGLPASRPALARHLALAGAAATLALSLILWAGFEPHGPALQWRSTAAWIPSIGATYDVAVTGLSLSLIVLTALLLTIVMIYVLPQRDRARAHAFLFLLLATGLLGVFAARDLLLFYLFFEIGLVPMYFIIGLWGGPARRYAALKFFLYTRAGSLAMLLAFLGLYLAMRPHTFSLDAIIRSQPLAGSATTGALVLFGLLVGFGVKLPTVPLHNWLPDAHTEAPTEGSVILAGAQLKMGGYGLLAVLLPALAQTVRDYAGLLIALAIASLLYGALAALAQSDMKRLVAYTSINHMAYVLLAVGVAALASDPAVRLLALNGAAVQMVSHGLLTGAMFLMIGMLEHRAGTRELARFAGLTRALPAYSGLFALIAFGSFGLPGLSGFVAEFQVIGAALDVSLWMGVLVVVGIVIMTAAYLRLTRTLMGSPPATMPALTFLSARETTVAGILAACSVLLGVAPGAVIAAIEGGTRLLAGR